MRRQYEGGEGEDVFHNNNMMRSSPSHTLGLPLPVRVDSDCRTLCVNFVCENECFSRHGRKILTISDH